MKSIKQVEIYISLLTLSACTTYLKGTNFSKYEEENDIYLNKKGECSAFSV